MKILAIETSCDDTGISILEIKESKNSPEFNVLSNVIASQVAMGKKYGGVFPMMAKREHQKNLVPVLIKALKESKLLKPVIPTFSSRDQKVTLTELENILDREPELHKKLIPVLKKYVKPDIDLIAVTNGPGLEPCLWVGVNFAKCLSYFWNIPIVPVNHIESHILVNTLENPDIKFPAIALVVSGGHTQIILVKKIGDYQVLGETRDDAAGECFDKCAKILGLGYPGGPIIASLAQKSGGRASANSVKLPRPMISTKDYDFSFSGLKTAVLYAWQKEPASAKKRSGVAKMAAEIQQAIIDVLIKKTMQAVKDYGTKTLILGGGVSANQELRKQFSDKFENVIFPNPKLSTDNGLMIAVSAFYHQKETKNWQTIEADGNLRIG